jgi:hypothetical protein
MSPVCTLAAAFVLQEKNCVQILIFRATRRIGKPKRQQAAALQSGFQRSESTCRFGKVFWQSL